MLALFDLDKTLIDVGYRYTDDGIADAVARAIGRGHVIGLSSDSPVPVLRRHHRELGMNGPIVAERGAVLWLPNTPTRTYTTGTAPLGEFPDLRDRVLRRLTADGEVEAVLGDPSGIIRARRFHTGEPQSVLLASALRTHSLHFATRRIVGDRYDFDLPLLERVHAVTREEVKRVPISGAPLEWDLNPEYSLLILHAAASQKNAGTANLLAGTGAREAIMVGDSMPDHLGLPLVRQWAVGNAHQDYKAVCERVASATFTSGAIELLDALP